jgi:arylsulfatase
MTLSAGFVSPAAAQGGFALSTQTFRQHSRADHAGVNLQSRSPVNHLPKDAPNILIVLIDDVGPAQTDAYGGEIHTPTLSKIANEGISYNRFTRPRCVHLNTRGLAYGPQSPSCRQRSIGELANDWDGYTGTIPKSSATVAEVLKDYGYSTAAWGSGTIHLDQTTAAGPFVNWPTGIGFQYFYGFLAGEASQWKRNSSAIRHTSNPALPAATITII